MTITNYARSGLALLMASGANSFTPDFCAIGSGSGAETTSVGSLVSEVLTTRNKFTGTPDTSTANETTWTFDFGAGTMSGINLTEFGAAGSQVKNSQTLWNREGFPAIEFDGTNELQIQIGYKIF